MMKELERRLADLERRVHQLENSVKFMGYTLEQVPVPEPVFTIDTTGRPLPPEPVVISKAEPVTETEKPKGKTTSKDNKIG